jgi:hypothetical protein
MTATPIAASNTPPPINALEYSDILVQTLSPLDDEAFVPFKKLVVDVLDEVVVTVLVGGERWQSKNSSALCNVIMRLSAASVARCVAGTAPSMTNTGFTFLALFITG